MLAIAYSGSFLMMEETSEKTEKTERSEEALHSIYHASGFQRTIFCGKKEKGQAYQSKDDPESTNKNSYSGSSDYNIDHIYFSSYLRLPSS